MKRNNFQDWCAAHEQRIAKFNTAGPPDGKRMFYVTSTIDHTRASEEERSVEATLSTTNPVIHFSRAQVLLHSNEAVDLHRLVNGGLPLLFSHDHDDIVGRAENVRVFDNKLRANLRFSKSARGEEVWQDVRDGITTGISIGYTYTADDIEFDDDSDNYVVKRWTPHEASVVSVPADIGARIERSLEMGLLTERPAELRVLNHQHDLYAHYRKVVARAPAIVTAEFSKDAMADIQRRIMDVKSDSDAAACRELLIDASVDFAAKKTFQPLPGFRANPTEHDTMEQFSLCRAIAMQFDPDASRVGGPELEIMSDVARRSGKRANTKYSLPEGALFTRAITKGSTGGNLIGIEHLGYEFTPVLRNRLITGRMGATLLTGLTGDLQVPKGLTDSSAGWIAGDGSDAVDASDPTFGKHSMAPKTVGVKSTLSRKMILQGDPASEMLLRNSLAFAVAKAIDSACLVGDGTGNVPVGILETSAIGTGTYTNGGLPTFGNIVDMEGALMIDDADTGNLGYVTGGTLAAKLKQTPIVAAMDTMIWTSDGEGEGRMNGHRALVSNIVPAGHVIFGNWADLVIGMWSGLDFTVDPYTRAAYGDVIITVLLDCDVIVRHGESFAEIHEAES